MGMKKGDDHTEETEGFEMKKKPQKAKPTKSWWGSRPEPKPAEERPK
ncbi:MAG TPA: hypothetical protein VOA88_10280 [Candidatus Dormibacteraeota bacterium]|nr:hypothetical protein [Candidatus Dormibacteraeota bacterium]